MHFSGREEAFRYSFPEPLKGKFQITRIDRFDVESSFRELRILEISLNGAKISTKYDLQIECRKIEITLHFQIVTMPWSIPGILVYEQPSSDDFIYGVHLHTSDTISNQLTNELKVFVWKLVEKKNN